jgi:hypothetical protein
MESAKASRTAEYMARAMESAHRRGRRFFTDPLAIHFLRSSLRRAAVPRSSAQNPEVRCSTHAISYRKRRGSRMSLVLRIARRLGTTRFSYTGNRLNTLPDYGRFARNQAFGIWLSPTRLSSVDLLPHTTAVWTADFSPVYGHQPSRLPLLRRIPLSLVTRSLVLPSPSALQAERLVS